MHGAVLECEMLLNVIHMGVARGDSVRLIWKIRNLLVRRILNRVGGIRPPANLHPDWVKKAQILKLSKDVLSMMALRFTSAPKLYTARELARAASHLETKLENYKQISKINLDRM